VAPWKAISDIGELSPSNIWRSGMWHFRTGDYERLAWLTAIGMPGPKRIYKTPLNMASGQQKLPEVFLPSPGLSFAAWTRNPPQSNRTMPLTNG
jgi:hypothetical protein